MTRKRELIARDWEQHCVRRDAETGQFREWDKVSRALRRSAATSPRADDPLTGGLAGG
jgi:hypothetical protein